MSGITRSQQKRLNDAQDELEGWIKKARGLHLRIPQLTVEMMDDNDEVVEAGLVFDLDVESGEYLMRTL